MQLNALLTSAGINVVMCVLFLSLYSVLRKQPGNMHVYFGRKLAQINANNRGSFSFERLVPSLGWMAKAWGHSDDDIISVAGLDAVVFIRIIVFSIRIFSIMAIVCMFVVLPTNHFGDHHSNFVSTSLDKYTIDNIQEGSLWLWVHCVSLYIISVSACILLYSEYKNITQMRLAHFSQFPPSPSHFTILVRAIPWSIEESFSDSVDKFFSNYHEPNYLAHQMIYRTGKLHMILNNAEKVYGSMREATINQNCLPTRIRCCVCGGTSSSFKIYNNIKNSKLGRTVRVQKEKECAAAFVFFKTRYAAVVATQVLQSSNPMLWVTDMAPEPSDVYWSNLWIPYKQLWIRHIAILLAAVFFMVLFIVPVTFVQSLTQLEQLRHDIPMLSEVLKRPFVKQLVSGYLPSVVLMLFLYTVPPTMMLFSSIEGPISRSARKTSACFKILCFNIWNVFAVNILSGSIISQLDVIFNPKDIPTFLAKAVTSQATFFTTYVLTSGWAGLASELMQLFPLAYNFVMRYVFRCKIDIEYVPSFPYHTEIPRVLLFGLLGFTCSILAPLIVPFLLAYFFLAYIVYRNQILNVYCSRYDTGGKMWPIAHNTVIFSLVLTQIISLGVFVLKKSPTSSSLVLPLIILTLLFHEYCKNRFLPIFNNISAQDLIDMDREDEQSGLMEGIHEQLLSSYYQPPANTAEDSSIGGSMNSAGQNSNSI